MTQVVTIYDELDRPYVCEVEVGGTRVLRVLETPACAIPASREERILEAGYQAYALEEGYYAHA